MCYIFQQTSSLLCVEFQAEIQEPISLIPEQSFHVLGEYLTHTSSLNFLLAHISLFHYPYGMTEIHKQKGKEIIDELSVINTEFSICYVKNLKINVTMAQTLFLGLINLSTKETLFKKKNEPFLKKIVRVGVCLFVNVCCITNVRCTIVCTFLCIFYLFNILLK